MTERKEHRKNLEKDLEYIRKRHHPGDPIADLTSMIILATDGTEWEHTGEWWKQRLMRWLDNQLEVTDPIEMRVLIGMLGFHLGMLSAQVPKEQRDASMDKLRDTIAEENRDIFHCGLRAGESRTDPNPLPVN